MPPKHTPGYMLVDAGWAVHMLIDCWIFKASDAWQGSEQDLTLTALESFAPQPPDRDLTGPGRIRAGTCAMATNCGAHCRIYTQSQVRFLVVKNPL